MYIEDLSYTEIEHLIDEYIHNGKYRDIAKRKLHNDEITFEKLAEEFDLSVSQTKNIIQKVKEVLKKHL